MRSETLYPVWTVFCYNTPSSDIPSTAPSARSAMGSNDLALFAPLRTEVSLKNTAEVFANLLSVGLVSSAHVIRWVDDRLLVTENPDYSLVEASLAVSDPNRLLGALRSFPGEVDVNEFTRILFSELLLKLDSDRGSARRIARLLYSLARDGTVADPETQAHLYSFDDALELAAAGIYGDYSQVVDELRDFLHCHGELP